MPKKDYFKTFIQSIQSGRVLIVVDRMYWKNYHCELATTHAVSVVNQVLFSKLSLVQSHYS